MSEKQFCSIKDASKITGISAKFIRRNIEQIPHGKSGRKYLVCLDGLKEFVLKTGKGGASSE
jgi:hypothetical protein